jgi:serine/threonine protein kinase
LARRKADDQLVAAKFIHANNVWHWDRDKHGNDIPLEISMMKTFLQLRVPRIIQYYEHFEIGKRFIIIMEYLGDEWIDLYDYIEFYGPVPEISSVQIFQSVVETIQKLHHLGYTHNDIKGSVLFNSDENIMIHRRTLEIKLIDFGSAMPLSVHPTTIFYGTQKFSCPEALGGNPYIPVQQEVWALGTLLYVLLFKMDPFANDDEISDLNIGRRMQRLRTGHYDFDVSDDAVEAITFMLSKNPEDRPTIDEILELPLFDN